MMQLIVLKVCVGVAVYVFFLSRALWLIGERKSWMRSWNRKSAWAFAYAVISNVVGFMFMLMMSLT